MEVPTSGPSRPSAPEHSIIRRQSSSERRMSIDSYREQSIPKAQVALHAPVPPPAYVNAHSHAQGIVHVFGGGLSLAITSVVVFQILETTLRLILTFSPYPSKMKSAYPQT